MTVKQKHRPLQAFLALATAINVAGMVLEYSGGRFVAASVSAFFATSCALLVLIWQGE